MKKQQTNKVKHVPQRTCIACRQILPKRSLLRLVRTPEGVKLDASGKITGRGAYLHDARSCWATAINRGYLARSLKTELTATDMENIKHWMESLPEAIQE